MTSDLVITGSDNYGLVVLSILIAMLGSYAAIDLADRVRASHGEALLSWRIGGATAMAIGYLGSAHYAGMLAFACRCRYATTGPRHSYLFCPAFWLQPLH